MNDQTKLSVERQRLLFGKTISKYRYPKSYCLADLRLDVYASILLPFNFQINKLSN
jgi:hypothetical protein